ncbi:hypothetical protein EB73_29180 [Mycobacterium sp. SWH-M3]|nr:hypothetical protein EB73_29180 [Mycobacterium sp. SWH-M3]
MLRAAHASHTGDLYLVDIEPPHGIVELVRDTSLETCTAEDRIVFWFTRSTNRAFMLQNAMATELLLFTTRFTARDVPILRGNIVITGRDGTGNPAPLNNHQLQRLTHSTLSRREKRILTSRFTRDRRTQRRQSIAEQAAALRAAQQPWTDH